MWFFPKNSWGDVVAVHPRKILSSFKLTICVSTSAYIITIGSPTQQVCPVWKRILTISKIMKAREPQKSQFPNCSLNWEKLGTKVQANIRKSQWSIFFMNREKLRVPARATFKNPNFQSFCELGKTWKHKSKIQKSQFWIYRWLKKLCLNLSFTAENMMGNVHKAGHISTLIWRMRYSIFSNFKNLSMNWVKYNFHLEKWNFEPTGNFAHTIGFLTIRKALIILLPLHRQMLIMQIAAQTDTHKYSKNVATKKAIFKIMILEFNILFKVAFIFLIKCQSFWVQGSICKKYK